jgi:K+-sensing histidine kinase KdpD
LIRDVGAFYLALALLTAIAGFARTAVPGRVVGAVWAVFGVLHFGYHVTHPEGTAADVAVEIVALAVSAALGILLALPTHRSAGRAAAGATR